MVNQVAVYLIMLLIFISGSIYHFRIRKECIYPVKLTKSRTIISIITLLIFCAIAYIGGNSPKNYPIAISASIFIISGIVGEGIHEKGIYYRPLGKGGLLMQLAKWEDIKNVKIDANKNKLESFKLKTITIFPDQHYNSKDIEKINKYIKIKSIKMGKSR